MVIINNELSIEHYNSKKMTTDILVEIEKNIINLEMNRYYYDGLFNKNDAYYHKLMADQYKRGDKKYKAKRIIQINFNNFILIVNVVLSILVIIKDLEQTKQYLNLK